MTVRRTSALALAGLVTALIALGLTGVPASAAVPTRPSPAKIAKAFRKYTSCMRAHGVDLPDPKVSSGNGGVLIQGRGGPGESGAVNPDLPAFKRANKVCQKYIKGIVNSTSLQPDSAQARAMKRQALKFARCMRSQGINFPDPQFHGGGVTVKVPEGANTAHFKAAQKHCAKVASPFDSGKGIPPAPSGPGPDAKVGSEQ
jgi:hypothetical protein